MKVKGKQLEDTLRTSSSPFTKIYSSAFVGNIKSESNDNIELEPSGTGKVTIKGNATTGSGQIVLNCEQNSNGIIIKGPPNSASASYTLVLPDDDGSSNQVLKTDGSGNLSWVDQSGGGTTELANDTSPQLGGTLDLNSQAIQGNLIPSAVNTYSLGSASAEWSDLFLGDGAVIYFGTDNDTKLAHSTDTGLLFFLANASEGNAEPVFELRNLQAGNDTGPVIVLNHQGSDANSDVCGILRFMADTSTTNTVYAYVDSTVIERDNGTHAGKLSFYVKSNASDATPLEIIGNSSDSNTETKVTKFLNVADHNGTTGLKLAGTLVTADASELNKLDGVTSTTAELNVIDGDTSATATTLVDADRVVVNDAGTMKQVAMTDLKDYVAGNPDLFEPSPTSTPYDITTHTGSEEIYIINPNIDINVTIPSASTCTKGYKYNIKNMSTNTITVVPDGNDVIDTNNSFALNVQYQSITIVSDGDDSWFII